MARKKDDKTSVIKTILEMSDYKESELKEMNTSELNEIKEDLHKVDTMLSTAIDSDNSGTADNDVKQVADHNRPDMYSAMWSDYVLSLFDKSELENGMPRTDALRRVSFMLLGQCDNITYVKQCPTIENAGRATVEVQLRYHNTGVTVSGAADVSSANTEKKFAVHAVATAETRAEGRAYRKALGLTKVLAAEELSTPDADESDGSNGLVPTGMANGLITMCNSSKLDPVRVANALGYSVASIEDLTKDQALEMAKALAEFKRGTRPIPEEARI